ncbi:MAG: hypothetical protein MJZ37_06440 [Bacilli bacterium]|nr:hypothetical protein [Bacilli bacterium]
MELVIITALVCLTNVICFIIGAKVGQRATNNEPITFPNPVKAVEEYRDNKEQREFQEQINTMLENINNYDGTGLGQKDI